MSHKKIYTPASAAHDVNAVLQLLRGRWKLLILFHLFDAKIQRFSDLERLIDGISQKMLAQQLRSLEHDGLLTRTVYDEKPIRVDYRLTAWGQQLCPMLDGMLKWADCRGSR
jgi:DNA-binding HxlR family transcriptional regulator